MFFLYFVDYFGSFFLFMLTVCDKRKTICGMHDFSFYVKSYGESVVLTRLVVTKDKPKNLCLDFFMDWGGCPWDFSNSPKIAFLCFSCVYKFFFQEFQNDREGQNDPYGQTI